MWMSRFRFVHYRNLKACFSACFIFIFLFFQNQEGEMKKADSEGKSFCLYLCSGSVLMKQINLSAV